MKPPDAGGGSAGNAAPPRFAVFVLRLVLRGRAGEALLGDVLETWDERVTLGGRGMRSRLWFWRETVAAVSAHWTGRSSRVAWRSVEKGPRGDTIMRRFLFDLRHAVHSLARVPLFTAMCALTLALGIGATTAIYSVANPVLLRPLAYPDPDRVVMVWERDEQGMPSNVGFLTYRDFRGASTLAVTAAMRSWMPTIAEGGEPERLTGQLVSASYFDVLGVRPLLGRAFRADEDVPGVPEVVVLGHGLWQRRFGGDPDVIGRAIRLDGGPVTVIGVMPPDFENVAEPTAQIWRPFRYEGTESWACRTCRHLRVIARVRADASVAAAQSELNALSEAIVREHPRDYPATGTFVVPLQSEMTRAARPILLVLAAAVALLLLLAVANVANLQLTRALRRESEFAIRSALGASRRRLVQQLLAEGLPLALLGGLGGVLLARLALPLLLTQLPSTLPRLAQIRLDGAALAVAALLTLVLGLAIGILPAWQRGGSMAALRDGARLAGGRPRRARALLVTGEITLALVLLAGATLLGRSLAQLLATDPGFDPEGLLALEVQATGPAYDTPAPVYANHARLLEAVRNVPGVTAAGIINQLPLGGSFDRYGIFAQDRPTSNPALVPSADRYVVTPGLLETMRIRILAGRTITAADADAAAPPVVIVSEELARRIWGDEPALGKRVRMADPNGPWREVVGIAAGVRHTSLDTDPMLQIYIPERQWMWPDRYVALTVRANGDAAAIAPAVRQAVHAVDPTQPITRLTTMEQLVSAAMANRRLAFVLFAAFSLTALLMAAAGIYGVLAGSVTERTREIGVRSVLGATPRDIVALVSAQGAWLLGAGLVFGLAGAVALGRVLRSLLYGVSPGDPATLAVAAVFLVVVASAACLILVRRAIRIDPARALRID